MAVTASGLYVTTFLDVFDATQLALNLVATDYKVAMFTNSITPNFSSDTAYGTSPYDANEVSGAGYTGGGATIGSATFTESPTGTVMWDAADPSWTTSTITSARCALYYADSLAGNNVICLQDFGQDYSTSSGTFTIQEPTLGIFYIDLTP